MYKNKITQSTMSSIIFVVIDIKQYLFIGDIVRHTPSI